jgi:hypothetical protein
VSNDSSTGKLWPRSHAWEIVLGAVLFAGSAALAWYGIAEERRGSHINGDFILGLALVLFGGCFDPVNCVCFLCPFIWRHVAVSPPFWKIGVPFLAIGFVLCATGWVARHWLQ